MKQPVAVNLTNTNDNHSNHGNHDKALDNQQMLSVLHKIHQQNIELFDKIDNLETNMSKKAAYAGAIAGAFTGGVSGGVIGIGIELLKAKFGG